MVNNFETLIATFKAVNQVKRLLLPLVGETSCYYITPRMDDILVDCWVLRDFGSLAEATLRNLNPIPSQAVIKGKHLLVDKLIST